LPKKLRISVKQFTTSLGVPVIEQVRSVDSGRHPEDKLTLAPAVVGIVKKIKKIAIKAGERQ
jgi:hypothetical protein